MADVSRAVRAQRDSPSRPVRNSCSRTTGSFVPHASVGCARLNSLRLNWDFVASIREMKRICFGAPSTRSNFDHAALRHQSRTRPATRTPSNFDHPALSVRAEHVQRTSTRSNFDHSALRHQSRTRPANERAIKFRSLGSERQSRTRPANELAIKFRSLGSETSEPNTSSERARDQISITRL